MNLINIYSAAGKLEAEILKGFLEAQGLMVVLSQESLGRTMGLSVGGLGKVHVLVPDSQVEEAKLLLAAIANGEYNQTNGDDHQDKSNAPEN
jgi:hypothetical protein